MKTLLKPLFPFAALLLLAGCLRNNIRTETFQINQLRSQNSITHIQLALKPLPGIQDIRTDLAKHTLTVVYNANDSHRKNIEYALVKAGFDLPNWPADPADKAKLSEDAR